jgi:hypothetical protein
MSVIIDGTNGVTTAAVFSNTIQSSANGSPPQFNEGAGSQIGTLCRAWVNYGYISSSMVIANSFNVSSVTRNGTGEYTVTLNKPMPDTSYAVVTGGNYSNTILAAAGQYDQWISAVPASTSNVYMVMVSGGGTFYDGTVLTCAIFR